jgi:TRAP-type mannitol/chloroaromatic compound transport system substrate-binding protein
MAAGRAGELVIVSTWPRDFPGLGISAQRLAARITELSEGRITTQYFAAGERVGAFDSFDEVASGNARPTSLPTTTGRASTRAGPIHLCAVRPDLHRAERMAALRRRPGPVGRAGWRISWPEVPCAAATGCQMGGWFNKEINSADDLKGLKMRIPGLGGDVMAKLGASPVSLPGGQIYENLVSGAIDATEWVGPYNDYFMKFYEAAKYYYYPGFHEPGGNLAFGMNKSFWEGLSDIEKAIITAACNEEHGLQMDETNANNGTYLNKLMTEHGVELKGFTEDTYDAFGKASAEVFEEVKAHSDLAARILTSFEAARKDIGGWMKISDRLLGTAQPRARLKRWKACR